MQNIQKNVKDIIKFENVGLSYDNGPDILKDISFAIHQGEFYFLTGPSGSGKTSLLSLIYLMRRPTSGRVMIFENDTNTATRDVLTSIRSRIGVVFQDYHLLPHLSVFDNVALPLRVIGEDEATINHKVTELLNWVGIKNHSVTPPTLSGGQQQAVAIARAVINRPQILLADEPTGNVDDKMAKQLMFLFIELNKRGTSTIFATHNQNMIEKFDYPRLHIKDGKVKVVNSRYLYMDEI